jgi:hypothetical protein
MAVFAVFLTELLVTGISNLTLKHLAHNFFFYWGFMYPASFAAYEAACKHNKELKK